eukprot:TCONS_00058935-protein
MLKSAQSLAIGVAGATGAGGKGKHKRAQSKRSITRQPTTKQINALIEQNNMSSTGGATQAGGPPPMDFQNSTYTFGGVTYQYQGGPKPDYKNNKKNGKDFDPFYDRGKLRTKRVKNNMGTEEFERRSSAVHGMLKCIAAPVLNKEVAPAFRYKSTKLFELALECYNRRGVADIHEEKENYKHDEDPVSWTCRWHWLTKGRVRAGQQLCIQCRDLGKPRGFMEQYYLNSVEIARSRTILCQNCMSLKLRKEVGENEEKICQELMRLRKKQNLINS